MNTPKPHAPITDLVALAFRGAKAVQTGFRAPTDDWQPILLFTTAEGRQHIIAAPHTDNQKQATADAITALLKRSHAVEALWLSSAWEVVPEVTDTALSDIRPARDPRRRETLVLVHVGTDFAAVHRAPIKRHRECGPTLGELAEADCYIDGLMSTALLRGIE